jgi:FdhD protein
VTATADVRVVTFRNATLHTRRDCVTVEEPLELRLRARGETRRIAVTMRTPGADLELAAGFVLGEGIVADRDAIAAIRHCDDRELSADERGNVVTVDVTSTLRAEALLERHFTVTSACGVCGSAGIEALRARGHRRIEVETRLDAAVLASLPERMRERQRLFGVTGGLHAAALFSLDGRLLALREDVGRHNAVDKIAGWLALRRPLDPAQSVLVVSGRCSYEIVQKALAAGVPIVASVSAPSSLAVDLAGAFGVTLAGFVRDGGWNAYANVDRIRS